MANELVNLNKRAIIEQHFNALTRGLLALCVLLFGRCLAGCVNCFVIALFQVGYFSRSGA